MNAAAVRERIASKFGAAVVLILDKFVAMLIAENKQQNLVSRETTSDELWLRHILDSIQLLDMIGPETGDWLDIGTGAGFPGLICAMVAPQRRYHLVEPRAQRASWLNRATEILELPNIVVHQKRAQGVEPLSVSIVSARAVAKLDILISLAKRHSRDDAIWLFPKGRGASAELRSSEWGKNPTFHVERSLTDPDAGIIVRRPVAGGPNP